jgi:hypothetical protein
LTTETASPLWDTVPFHSWVTCWLPGKVHATVHEVIGAPRLVTDTLAPKPFDHWLEIEYVA